MGEQAGPLAGRTVLITGAARRVGAEVARWLHAEGMNVALHYHGSAAEAEALHAELDGRRPGSVTRVRADLREAHAPERVVEAARAAWGRLDVLINNASTFYATPLGTVTAAQWDDLMGTNLRAPLFLAQAAAPALREAGGAIVNMADIYAQRPLADHPVYCAAKAGLVALTRSLAKDLGPEVRVNAVAPGAVLWPEAGADALGGAETEQHAMIARTALKRAGEPADIARAVRYLLADAGYVTGHVLAVDGGRSLGW